MTTVQEVFDMSIHLMDEQNEATGNTETQDTAEYRYRTISILNALLPALFPYSDTCPKTRDGTRPPCPALRHESYQNPDFSQQLPLDDTLSRAVLPYGLAAHLMAGENETLSAWFLSMFNQKFVDLRNKVPAKWERIPLPFGGISRG